MSTAQCVSTFAGLLLPFLSLTCHGLSFLDVARPVLFLPSSSSFPLFVVCRVVFCWALNLVPCSYRLSLCLISVHSGFSSCLISKQVNRKIPFLSDSNQFLPFILILLHNGEPGDTLYNLGPMTSTTSVLLHC